MPPGSSPPWPAEIATTISRLSPDGVAAFEATLLVALSGLSRSDPSCTDKAVATRSSLESYRSTTRRWPCSALGSRVKLLGWVLVFRSITTRSRPPSRVALRRPVMGLSSNSMSPRRVAKEESAMSITTRSGASRVKSLYSTPPLRSNTSLVWSGARQSLRSRTSAA